MATYTFDRVEQRATRFNDDGSTTSIVVNGAGWQDFLAWNDTQQPPLDLTPQSPTVIPTPIKDYAQGFINNAALWVKLHKALDDERHTFDISTATATTILNKLHAQLKAARALIATAPQGVIDEFHRERVLMGSTTTLPFDDAKIDLMTAAECRICITAIRLAANLGLAVVTAANSLNE